jgi:hypothetical protein
MINLIKRGHLIGGGMLSPNKEYFYLNIPKNASTFTTNLLKDNGWTHWNLTNGTYKNVIIVLRDPIDRWVSGVSTYLCSYVLGENYGSDHFVADYNEAVERLLFDTIVFDDHTAPQTVFVNEIPNISKRLYITLDHKTLVDSISTMTGHLLNVTDGLDDNSKETNYDNNQLSNFIRGRLTPSLEQKLKNAYADDYRLLQNTSK